MEGFPERQWLSLAGCRCRGDFTIFRDRLQKDDASHVHNANFGWKERKRRRRRRRRKEVGRGGECK